MVHRGPVYTGSPGLSRHGSSLYGGVHTRSVTIKPLGGMTALTLFGGFKRHRSPESLEAKKGLEVWRWEIPGGNRKWVSEPLTNTSLHSPSDWVSGFSPNRQEIVDQADHLTGSPGHFRRRLPRVQGLGGEWMDGAGQHSAQ